MRWTYIVNKRTMRISHTKAKDSYPIYKRAIADQLITLAKEALASSRHRHEDIAIRHDENND